MFKDKVIIITGGRFFWECCFKTVFKYQCERDSHFQSGREKTG